MNGAVRHTEAVQLTVPLLVAAHAREHPNQPVLTDLRRTWTWAEVAAQAAGVARRLIEHGGTQPVVLLADRGLESVAAVYGIWWAGRCLVVLDASEPIERRAQLAERSGADLVIDATASGEERLGELEVWAMPAPAVDATTWPEVQARPAGDVCILQFTSGSTGRPKCVAKTFANMVRAVDLFRSLRGYMAIQRSAVFMPIHFAGGFALICTGLALGRFTALVDMAALDVDELCRSLETVQIERLHLTASAMRTLAAALPAGRAVSGLREVWLTGEPVHGSDVLTARQHFGGDIVVGSGYGATERLGLLCEVMVGASDEVDDGPLPLGWPTGPDVYRLDTTGRDDGSGEIVYRGEVSAGYFDDPELNASRFGTDPDGVRTWRSGDLATVDSTGRLVHRGRVDDMVKIGGRLVEPAETEAVVRTLPGIRDVAVLGRTLPNGRAQLIAHLCVDDLVDADVIRHELRRRLPAHLVPAVLVRHDRLPMTDRGKVDRETLRTAPVRPWVSGAVRAAADPRVMTVCALAATVLGLDDVDPDDQLWDLGLDSLGAIELLATLADSTGMPLDVSALVRVSTCRELAAEAALGRSRRGDHVVVINDRGTAPPWFCVAGAGGTALGFAALAAEAGPDQPLVVFEQCALHRRARRDRTVRAAARRNLAAVRNRAPHGPYVFVGHSWGGLVAQEMARHAVRAGDEVRLVLLDTERYRFRGFWSLSGAPPAIAERRDVWPVWCAKWLVWSLYRVRRQLGRRDWLLRPGTPARYGSLSRTAMRAARRHHAQPLDVDGALICPLGSHVLGQWDDHPHLLRFTVGGDHLGMMYFPHVVALVDAIQSVATAPRRSQRDHP